MNFNTKKRCCLITITLLWSITAFVSAVPAASVFGSGDSVLAGAGSSSSYVDWVITENFKSTDGKDFYIGQHGNSYNRVTIGAGQTFTEDQSLTIGPAGSHWNVLAIASGAQATISQDLKIGVANIMYTSIYNHVDVQGLLNVGGTLTVGNFYNAADSILTISNGGVVMTDDFGAYNHWCYENSWLELHNGLLAIAGNNTADFADGQGILSSIKIWDEDTEAYQLIAYYESTTFKTTAYYDQLEVEYVSDADTAELLGLSTDFVGYTIVRDTLVPVPGSMTLLFTGLWGLCAFSRKRDSL